MCDRCYREPTLELYPGWKKLRGQAGWKTLLVALFMGAIGGEGYETLARREKCNNRVMSLINS